MQQSLTGVIVRPVCNYDISIFQLLLGGGSIPHKSRTADPKSQLDVRLQAIVIAGPLNQSMTMSILLSTLMWGSSSCIIAESDLQHLQA